MRLTFGELRRRLRSPSPSSRSRATDVFVGALVALVLGASGNALVAQQTGSGVIPVTAPFTGGGVMSGPLQVTALGVGVTTPSAGQIQTSSDALIAGAVRAGASQYIGWNGRSVARSPADAQINLLNTAEGAGVGLAFATDGLLAIRNRAQNADAELSASNIYANGSSITVGAGTGITVNSTGTLRRQVYKVTVDRTAFICAAVTCDLTIGTLPAKTNLVGLFADLTQVFACSAVCTSSTLSMTSGPTVGTFTFLTSFDADAAITLIGDADAELGTLINRGNAVQAAYTSSFSSTTTITIRLISGTGNIGTGAATNLSTGSITFYVITERLP